MFLAPKKLATIASVLLLLPLITLAQQQGNLKGIAEIILEILDLVVAIVMALALIYFFIGLGKYILSAGDDTKKGEGRNIMIYGIIALFVMVTVWGLVAVLNTTFLGGTTGPIPTPSSIIPDWDN